jgi:hypothetical protein
MTSSDRISIYYGGLEYAITGRTLDAVKEEIEKGIASETPTWLEARLGQGRSTPVHLLVGPGIAIAVADIDTDGHEAPRDYDASAEGTGLAL